MLNNEKLASLRGEYAGKTLDEKSVLKNPFEQLKMWLTEAIESSIIEPHAMVLSTVDRECTPSSRVVLLKGIYENKLQFFTNYTSNKAKNFDNNPHTSLLFFWRDLGRQIRITGIVNKTSREESEKYFSSRPYESKIAASISNQSSVIAGRSFLENKFEELKKKYPVDVPLPESWGGYNFVPSAFEFWQGRENRMHDRILYKMEGNNWVIKRLAP